MKFSKFKFFILVMVFVTSINIFTCFQSTRFALSFSRDSFDLVKILNNGPDSKKINFLILGDGYTKKDLSAFEKDATNACEYIFNTGPFTTYRNNFNVYALNVISNETGASFDNTLVDSYFGSKYGISGIDRLLAPTKLSKIESLQKAYVPLANQVILIINCNKYGGSGGQYCTTTRSSFEVMMHELGHSFANLCDEYWAGNQYAREGPNMTKNKKSIPLSWKQYIGKNNIGIYPYEENSKWFRPSQNCKMRVLGNPYCDVCKNAIIKKIRSNSVAN